MPGHQLNDPLWVLAVALLLTLLAALVLSAIARAVLGRRAHLRLSTAIIMSILGSAAGMLVVFAIRPSTPVRSVLTVGVCLAGSIAAIAAYSALAARMQRKPPISIPEILAAGETDHVEFKSTARINLHTGEKDARMETVVLKTVSGFLNADGGTLLIGVDDDARPLGLAHDYATLRTPDADRYELWLRDLLSTNLGQTAAASVAIAVEDVAVADGHFPVCRVVASSSPRPVYLSTSKNGQREFWVRSGNSTRQLSVDQAAEYIMHRWPLAVGPAVAAQFRAVLRFAPDN